MKQRYVPAGANEPTQIFSLTARGARHMPGSWDPQRWRYAYCMLCCYSCRTTEHLRHGGLETRRGSEAYVPHIPTTNSYL